MKRYLKAILGVLAVVCAYANYNRALDFASDAIMELLPNKKGEE